MKSKATSRTIDIKELPKESDEKKLILDKLEEEIKKLEAIMKKKSNNQKQ
jgi:hypothetical protein